MILIDEIEKNKLNLADFAKKMVSHINSSFSVREYEMKIKEIRFSKASATNNSSFNLFYIDRMGNITTLEDENKNATVTAFMGHLKNHLPKTIKDTYKIFHHLDVVNYSEKRVIVLSLPDSKNNVVIADIDGMKLHSVNKERLDSLGNLLANDSLYTQDVKDGLSQIRKNLVVDSNVLSTKDYYKTFFKDENNKFRHGLVFEDFTSLVNGTIKDIDIEKYFDEKTNPIVNADTYLIWNKNDNEHFFKNKSNDSEAFDFIVNNLDQSKFWNYIKVSSLLKDYKNICDEKKESCKYNTVEDIIDNKDSVKEIISLRNSYRDEKNNEPMAVNNIIEDETSSSKKNRRAR